MNSNKIAYLPPNLTALKSLRELYLNDNVIQSLPRQIADFTGLRALGLARNQLSNLPSYQCSSFILLGRRRFTSLIDSIWFCCLEFG